MTELPDWLFDHRDDKHAKLRALNETYTAVLERFKSWPGGDMQRYLAELKAVQSDAEALHTECVHDNYLPILSAVQYLIDSAHETIERVNSWPASINFELLEEV